jgi:hypothetical protein
MQNKNVTYILLLVTLILINVLYYLLPVTQNVYFSKQ